ncbi:MAG: hypothetical protein FWG77_04725 [Treponema sp.]|nr:hypothetical protein [Treponema sp.]
MLGSEQVESVSVCVLLMATLEGAIKTWFGKTEAVKGEDVGRLTTKHLFLPEVPTVLAIVKFCVSTVTQKQELLVAK